MAKEMKSNKDLHKTVRNQREKNKIATKKGENPKVYNLLQEIDEEEKVYANNEQFGKCQKCGEVFEQDYRADINTYSNHKTCHKCRWKKAKKTSTENETAVQVSSINYTPYPWQLQFHKDCERYRRIVMACSSRLGKNRATNMQLISDFAKLLNENRHINRPDLVPSIHCWFIAPTEPMALQNWRELKSFFPKEWIVSISESTKTIETIGGGIIEIRSAYNPESLVGVALDFCNITEGARVKDLDEVASNIEDRLNSNGRGINGQGGRLIVDSSPLGKNFFYKMWTWGQKNHPDYDPDWISYQLDYTHNPQLKEKFEEVVIKNGEEITRGELLKRRKGKKFLQDNLAQFLDVGGTVFPNLRENCVLDVYAENRELKNKEVKELIKNMQEPIAGEIYRIGYDPASGSGTDNPVLVIRQMSNNRIVKAIDLYGYYDNAQLDKVAYWAKYYNDAEVCALTTAMYFLAGQLEERGVNVIDVGEQGQKKKAYISCLQTVISSRDCEIIDDGSAEIETLIFQMEDYSESESGKFGNNTASNDDYVSAMYAVFHDYLEVPEIKSHFTGKMRGLGRQNSKSRYKNK